jgi:hypothetical protein
MDKFGKKVTISGKMTNNRVNKIINHATGINPLNRA